MGTFDFYGPLSQIGKQVADSWNQGVQRQSLAELGKIAGTDPLAASQQAFALGNTGLGLGLMELAEKQRLRTAAESGDAAAFGLLGGGAGNGGTDLQRQSPLAALGSAGGTTVPVAARAPPMAALPDQGMNPDAAPLPPPRPPQPISGGLIGAGPAAMASLPAVTPGDAGSMPDDSQLSPGLRPGVDIMARRMNRPPSIPPDAVNLPVADMPAAGAVETQFRVPGTDQSVPASVVESSPRLQQIIAAAQKAKSPEARQVVNTLLTNELARIRASEDEARKDARGPEVVQEWRYARANSLTTAKSPAEYAREKAAKPAEPFTLAPGAVRYDASGKPIANVPREPKEPTEGQSNANLYVRRMEEAESILAKPEMVAASMGPFDRAASKVPGVGNYVVSSNFQQAEQAQRDFVNAVLRRESGAAIAATEFDNAKRQYFPLPGDSPAVISQKAENRKTAIEGIRAAAGPAYARPAPKQTERLGQPARADLEAEARRRGLIP